LTVAEVIAIHDHQVEEFGGMHARRDQGALESAVFLPQTGYDNDVSQGAAVLLESLVNHDAFPDGNKRVVAAAHTFLLVRGFDRDATRKAAFEFMRKTMADGKFRFGLLYKWILEYLAPLAG
jgi:death-on-curing protein